MKQLKMAVLLSITLLAPVLMSNAHAQKKISLKYALHQGKQYLSTTNIDQDIEMQAQGQTMTLNQVITTEVTTKIINQNRDSVQTVNKIDKMTMKQSINGQEMNYDSSDPTTYESGRGKQIGTALNKVIHKDYGITIDNLGNIINFDLKNLLDDNNKMSGDISSGNSFIIYPNHKIMVGDSWEADINPMKGSKMKVHVKYTLKKVSGKKATIEIEGTITANDDNKLDMKLSGTQSGDAIVNTRSGWALEMNIDQELKMEVSQNGMTIPMTISSTITKKSKLK